MDALKRHPPPGDGAGDQRGDAAGAREGDRFAAAAAPAPPEQPAVSLSEGLEFGNNKPFRRACCQQKVSTAAL